MFCFESASSFSSIVRQLWDVYSIRARVYKLSGNFDLFLYQKMAIRWWLDKELYNMGVKMMAGTTMIIN